MKPLVVLSLFDGMACGYEALKRIGLPVKKYYSSEIDKYAMQVAKKNHPDIIHVGDINEWYSWDIEKPDLIIGGSPCQGFSFAGKQLAFDDPRSKLFFDMIEVIKHYKPRYKMLENVRMKKEFQDIITGYMGCGEPVKINSSMLSAQNRVRYYWCNWEVPQAEDKGILLKDIVHEFYEGEDVLMRDKSCTVRVGGRGSPTFSKQEGDNVYSKQKISSFNVNPSGKGMNGNVRPVTETKSNTLTTDKGEGSKISIPLQEYIVPFDKTLKILDKEVERGKVGYFRKDSQANRVYYIHNKAVTLCGEAGGGAAKMGQYLFGCVQKPGGNNKGGLRNDGNKSTTMTSNSWEHNNHLLFGCITPDRVSKRQNGPRFNTGQKFYTLTAQDKHGILVEGYIRKLTPIECERLQTLPDNYTDGVSNSQRYKMLGNGWTCDVIAHIFEHMIEHDLY